MNKRNHKRLFGFYKKLSVIIAVFCISGNISAQQINVVIAGLNHDHVHGILNRYKKGLVNIVGIAEPDKRLQEKYAKLYHLPDSLFFTDLKKLLLQKKPDAVLGYNAAGKHLEVVQNMRSSGYCGYGGKPLAANLAQAKQIEFLANTYHIKVLTNYETTWYSSYNDVYNT